MALLRKTLTVLLLAETVVLSACASSASRSTTGSEERDGGDGGRSSDSGFSDSSSGPVTEDASSDAGRPSTGISCTEHTAEKMCYCTASAFGTSEPCTSVGNRICCSSNGWPAGDFAVCKCAEPICIENTTFRSCKCALGLERELRSEERLVASCLPRPTTKCCASLGDCECGAPSCPSGWREVTQCAPPTKCSIVLTPVTSCAR